MFIIAAAIVYTDLEKAHVRVVPGHPVPLHQPQIVHTSVPIVPMKKCIVSMWTVYQNSSLVCFVTQEINKKMIDSIYKHKYILEII